MSNSASSRSEEAPQDPATGVAAAPVDHTQVIVANNALPTNEFPPNVPSAEDVHLHLDSVPRVLNTVEELEKIIAESRERPTFSNFADVQQQSASAKLPIFPTFTRFSSTRFANAESAAFTVVESTSQASGALYDLSYPIVLSVSDGDRMPIPGIPPEGLLDSTGYPLLYKISERKFEVKARSSGAMFPANLSRTLSMRSGPYPDQNTIRAWTHMFQLSNERDAQYILLNRVMAAPAGDNHIALLVKAYLSYFDSVAAALDGVQLARNSLSGAGTIVNVAKQEAWPATLITSQSEVVNVLGGSTAYQEFWAHCCFDEPPVYAAKVSGGVTAATQFSQYRMAPGMSMVCLCDFEAYTPPHKPAFFGRPNLVLGFIETYIQRNSLQHQANEALQIAMLWPTLRSLKIHISLPKPMHVVDWFAGEVESTTAQSAYTGLVASSPFVALASTLAGAWALRSQIYDYVTLLTADRNTWKLSPDSIKLSVSWLMTHASAPGVGWDFLLRHQFHISPSFLYLVGLSVEVVNWSSLLSGLTWEESQFPAHLRLIQPFWVSSSVSCLLPWEAAWTPSFQISQRLLSAEPATIMTLIRLGLLSDEALEAEAIPNYERGVFPVLRRKGHETVQIASIALERLRVIKGAGVRVLAICGQPPRRDALGGVSSGDPTDVNEARESWSIAGVLQNLFLQERGGDAMAAPSRSYRLKDVGSQAAVDAAAAKLEVVKTRLADLAHEAALVASSNLLAHAERLYMEPDTDMTTVAEEAQVMYSPQTSGDCGWWCAVYLMRFQNQDQQSLACLRKRVVLQVGPATMQIATLSMAEMAGICSALKLRVHLIFSQTAALCPKASDDDAQQQILPFMLRLRNGHWEVVKSPDLTVASGVDMANLPVSSSGDELSESIKDKVLLPPPRPEPRINIATRARYLDMIIQKWTNGVAPLQQVIAVHQRLFPTAWLPRFLLSARQDAKPLALAENENGQASSSEAHDLLTQYVDARSSTDFERFLSDREAHVELPAEEAELTWPFRAPENAPKNNLDVKDLIRILDVGQPQERLALWFIWRHRGNHGEFVTAVGVWIASVDICDSAWMDLLQSGLFEANEDNWLQLSQTVHDGWRKAGLKHCSCSNCWAQLLYPQSLWGRGGVEVDWKQELSNKARVPEDIVAYTGQVWSSEYASDLIRQSAREVLGTAVPLLRLETFDDFMDRAYEWLVGGSTAGMPSAFKDTNIRDEISRIYGIQPQPTKRSVMEKIPREHILDQLKTRPQIVAKLHQKLNETGGKTRAIYGVTLWHYIFSNWLMAPFEKTIDHENIDINIQNDRFVSLQVRRAQAARSGGFFSSYDYPDFNAMHTHAHMAIIYQEAASVARGSQSLTQMQNSCSELVMQGYKWLEEAVFTQVCYLPEVDTLIQTVGGLYSGNRDTTLINTILNIAYAKIVDVSCRNMDMDPGVNWRLCHGDDIITQHETYGSALAWNAVASKAKLRGQEKKLLTDQSYHEYLRIMGCPDGKLRGSLARVVATFVNGNWETGYTAGAFAKATELQSSIAILRRRGARREFADTLWAAAIKRVIAAISPKDHDADRLRGALTEIARIVTPSDHPGASTADGVAHVEPSSGDEMPQAEQLYGENEPRGKYDVERMFAGLPDYISGPYTERLLSSLPADKRQQPFLRARLKARLQKSTYGTELPSRFSIEIKQTPQLVKLARKFQEQREKRGKCEHFIRLTDVREILQEHRVFATTLRRMKAFYVLLSCIDDLGDYSKTELIAHLCRVPEAVVRNVLITQNFLEDDWRRLDRPSASDVAALENELELYLTGEGKLDKDEEVVVYTDDGTHALVPLRDIMLY